MPISIRKRAEECFGGNITPHFQFLPQKIPSDLESLFLTLPDEECIGIYRNRPDDVDGILITGLGIHLPYEDVFIRYTEIQNIEWKSSSKRDLANLDNRALLLHLVDGKTHFVSIQGDWFSNELECGGLDLGNFQQFLQSARIVASIRVKENL